MEWPGYDAFSGPRVVVADRPGRGRLRQDPRQNMYFVDPNGNLLPQAGMAMGRSNSMSGGRPAQIVINNSQYDEFSPPHSAHVRRKSRARSLSYDDDDDSWDERAHSPRRRRDHSRNPSRRRSSRDRSRHRSRSRSRSRSHSRRRHSHSHHRDHHHSPSPSPTPHFDYETERRMKKLEDLERKEEEEAARQRAKQEMLLAEAEKAAKKRKEEEFKKQVLAEAEREKYEKELKEKKRKEEEDKIFKARLKDMYLAQGYSEESIEIMIKDAEEKKKNKGHHSPKGTDIVKITTEQTKVMDLSRPTYIKVNRKYLSPETLDAYGLPWEWDDRDSTYIVIKRWINENDQEKLFEHTRRLREQRLAITNESNMVEIKKEKGKLKLVREKSPGRPRSRSTSRAFVFI